MEDCAFARDLFGRFSKKAGAAHIASEVSLRYLATCLRLFKPRSVLELGAGIGTITEALLTHPTGIEQVVSTEQEEFCLRTIRTNLTDPQTSRLTLVSTPAELGRLNFTADMIVGDGGFYSAEEMSTAKLNTVFFCEGARSKLREKFAGEIQQKGWRIDFNNYGRSSGYAFSWRPFPMLRRQKVRGCWIGVVGPSIPQQGRR